MQKIILMESFFRSNLIILKKKLTATRGMLLTKYSEVRIESKRYGEINQ